MKDIDDSPPILEQSGASQGTPTKVPRVSVFPWPMQPRKHFDLEYLNQLAASIEKHGILNDLLCRPRPGHAGELEIIGGECRWRAAEMAGLEEVPVKVSELSDGDALELALVDNMKRKDLSELEECDAFHDAMAQTDDAGITRYGSAAELARRLDVSKGYVSQRLRLRKLTKLGRTALEAGTLSFRTARVVTSKPAAIIEAILDVILNPKKHSLWFSGVGYVTEPLTAEQAEEMIAGRFVRDLRKPPFSLSDAKLLPLKTNEAGERVEGGECASCPWNTANSEEEAEPGKKVRKESRAGKSCLNPACFAKKVEIHTAAALVEAKLKGCRILTDQETKNILYNGGELKHNAGYVRLDEKPGGQDRNGKLEEKKTPTWEKIVTGAATPPIVVAVDKSGNVHRLVERKLAAVAAQKNGTAHFLNLSSGAARSVQQDDFARRAADERAAQKLKASVSLAAVAEVIAEVGAQKEPDGFWGWMMKIAAWHGGSDAAQFVVKRRSLTDAGSCDAQVEKEASRMNSLGERRALAIELLIGRLVKFNGIGDAEFEQLAGLYKVDLKAIDKKIREEAKAQKKEKAAKGKSKKSKVESGKAGKPAKAEKAGAPNVAKKGVAD